MLLYPRRDRMFEMKRPHDMGGFFDDDFDSYFSGGRGPYENRPKRIPVPVHHQDQAQPQMPARQPTGNAYGYQQRAPSPSAQRQANPMVRSPIQIPVSHVLIGGEEIPISIEVTDNLNDNVAHNSSKPRTDNTPDDVQISHTDVTRNNPSLRKQTSLIVSDDHVTPIPMSYEDSDGKIAQVPEENYPLEDNVEIRKHEPLSRKRSLVVSDDRTTPIAMPYQHIGDSPALLEERELVEDDCKDELDCAKPGLGVHEKLVGETCVNSKPQASANANGKIPITVAAKIQKPQKSGLKRYVLKAKEGPSRSQIPDKNIAAPDVGLSGNGPPMPQPNRSGNQQPTFTIPVQPEESPSSSSVGSATPKPPVPAPGQQRVDNKITEALKSIDDVTAQAQELGSQVDKLAVTSKDRTYLSIEEKLTKLLLKLDSIDSFGDESVRSKRKACIKQVQQTLDTLELKLDAS